jgi:hypothetical protein
LGRFCGEETREEGGDDSGTDVEDDLGRGISKL